MAFFLCKGGINTSDGNVSSGDILKDKIAYSNGKKVVGTIPSKSAASYTPSRSNQVISSGQYLSGNQTIVGDSNLIAKNIKKGVSIFGVSGTCNELIDISNISNAFVGDTVLINHAIYGDIPFIVIGRNHDADNSVTLLTKDIVRLLPFDAKESSNTDDNRKSNGNNRYKYSNLLQWMNSDKAAGQWYTAQHSADAAPDSTSVVTFNPYSNVDGFLRGFSSDVVNQMITVDKTTALNTVTDGGGSEVVSSKIFLLSTTEVGLANENNIAEGKIYEYFSNNNVNSQRLAYPSTYCLNNAGGYTNNNFAFGKPWHWWLRTPSSVHSSYVHIVHASGALGGSDAYYGSNGLRLALSLKTT